MRRSFPLACLLLAAGLTAGKAQEKSDDILRIVKYDGLKDVILKNRGNVVIVEVWADW